MLLFFLFKSPRLALQHSFPHSSCSPVPNLQLITSISLPSFPLPPSSSPTFLTCLGVVSPSCRHCLPPNKNNTSSLSFLPHFLSLPYRLALLALTSLFFLRTFTFFNLYILFFTFILKKIRCKVRFPFAFLFPHSFTCPLCLFSSSFSSNILPFRLPSPPTLRSSLFILRPLFFCFFLLVLHHDHSSSSTSSIFHNSLISGLME